MVTFTQAMTLCAAPDRVHPANEAAGCQGCRLFPCPWEVGEGRAEESPVQL